MPKLWTETVESHRREVREAILDATAALVDDGGLRAVTMSRVAEATGIGRATLYKYFPDVEAVLLAWHERQINGHLEQLAAVRDRAREPVARLRAVLEAYARLARRRPGHHGNELAAALHRDEHVPRAHHRLRAMIADLVAAGVRSGDLRSDVSTDEIAAYCIHAVAAAGEARSEAATRRLVDVIVDGLRTSR